MKKVTLMMLAVALMLSSCAEKKTFKKCDGTSFVASPYGWANKEKQIDGVELWEPVNYTDPNATK